MHSFPADIWRWAGLPERDAALEEARGYLPLIAEREGAPRSFALVAEYARELSKGRVLIAGAGVHSETLLPLLRAAPTLDVAGFIDRRAQELDFTFCGLPVVDYPDISAQRFDYVLVAHPTKELELEEQLLASGISPDRVRRLYTTPEYAAFARGYGLEFFGIRPRQVEAAFVTAFYDPTRMIDDALLRPFLPPERTVDFYLGPPLPAAVTHNGEYELVDLRQSLALLDDAIAAFAPKVLWLRGAGPQFNHRALYLKARHPESTLVTEMFDFTLGIDPKMLRTGGVREEMIRVLHLSDHYAFQLADLVISKRGGRYWDQVLAHTSGNYGEYFPQVGEVERRAKPYVAGEEIKILYAGQVPTPAGARTLPSGYRFLPMMEAACAEGGISFDVYNSSHPDEHIDYAFTEYFERYGSDSPIRYHRRVPYSDLMVLGGDFHYAWLCDEFSGINGDLYYVITHRFTGYISAGVPILLDANWHYQADLLREFNAGLIIEDFSPGAVRRVLEAADHEALLAGVQRLRKHMLARNAETIAAIERVMNPSPART